MNSDTKGDRVIIYMPMIPQAAFAMLACARIGAIHSVVFGGFAPKELETRIDDAIDIAEHKPEQSRKAKRGSLFQLWGQRRH